MNHAAALTHAAQRTDPAIQFKGNCRFLRKGIRRHNRIDCLSVMLCGKSGCQLGHMLRDRCNRQRLPDDSGRGYDDLLLLYAQCLRRQTAHFLSGCFSVCIAGIRILTVGNHSTYRLPGLSQMSLCYANRCCLDLIPRINSCRLCRRLRYHQRQIILRRILIQAAIETIRPISRSSAHTAFSLFIFHYSSFSSITLLYAGRIILFMPTSSSSRCALHPTILAIANSGVYSSDGIPSIS